MHSRMRSKPGPQAPACLPALSSIPLHLIRLTSVLCPLSMQVHFLLWPLYSESPLSVIYFLWTFKCLFQVSDQMSSLREVFTCLLLPSHHIGFHYSYCLRNTRHLPSNWSVILRRAWFSCLVHWLL